MILIFTTLLFSAQLLIVHESNLFFLLLVRNSFSGYLYLNLYPLSINFRFFPRIFLGKFY